MSTPKLAFLRPFVILSALLLGIVSTTHLKAQEPPAISTTLNLAIWYDGVNLRPIITADGDKASESLYYLSQDKVIQATAPFGHFGNTVSYSGDERLAFYHNAPNPDVPQEPVVEIQLLPQVKETAILLFPDVTVTPMRYQARAFDCSLKAFPPESLYIANMFPKILYLKIGDNPVSIPAHSAKMIQVTDELNRGVNLLAVVKDDDTNRALPLIQRNIRMQPGTRLFLFITPHPKKLKGADLRIMEAPEAIISTNNTP